MMINRLELIEKLKAKIKEREERAAKDLERARFSAGQAREAYVELFRPHWAAFADRIRYRNRRGEPITAEDVPAELRHRDGWSGSTVVLFKPTEVKQSDHQPRVQNLQALLLILESTVDEVISTSALERMGAPVRELFR